MTRLLAVFAALIGVLLFPLALSAPTTWLLLPAHLFFSLLVTGGAVGEGLAGRPSRARIWGAMYIVATGAMIAALTLGSDVRGSGMTYWAVPFLAAMVWGWIPPTIAGIAGAMGDVRRRQLSNRAIRQRRLRG